MMNCTTLQLISFDKKNVLNKFMATLVQILKENKTVKFYILNYSRSDFVAGGFLVAQFVRIDLEPSHCPFIACIALSASCKYTNKKQKHCSWVL